MSSRRTRLRRIGAGAAMAIVLLVAAACSSSGSGGGADTSTSAKGSGTLDGSGKTVVFFTELASSDTTALMVDGVKQVADRYHWNLQLITPSDTDQSTLDGLVQQYIASGKKPAAFLFWPTDASASVIDVRLLSQIAPVIQLENRVLPSEAPYVTAFAGLDSAQSGSSAADMLLSLRAKLKSEGVKLHSSEGNLLILNFVPGFQLGIDRVTAFQKATASQPFNILSDQYGNYYEPQLSYEAASALIPKYRNDLDFVYVANTGGADGVVKALEQNGLTPNKNVWLIAGNCANGYQSMAAGDIYGTTMLSERSEGVVGMETVIKYLATGKVQPGSTTLSNSSTVPDPTLAAPYANNYVPVPTVVGANQFKSSASSVWGVPYTSTCS
jgi:ABC-type sugar transport system substrate-binding protein